MSDTTTQVFEDPDRHKPGFVPSQHLVTSVRVERGRGHDLVTVWNRGGNAGTLVVDAGDGERIAARLLGYEALSEGLRRAANKMRWASWHMQNTWPLLARELDASARDAMERLVDVYTNGYAESDYAARVVNEARAALAAAPRERQGEEAPQQP